MPEGPFGSGFNPLEDLVKGLVNGLEQSLGGVVAPEGRDRRTPALDRFGRDLTAEARAGKLDPVIGRDAEVAELLEVLSRRTKNNPVLIGDPGVGKTAIVEGVASRIAADTVPQALRGRRLVVLDLAGLVAGTRYRGDFEERFGAVIDEVLAADRNVLLFLDELHTIIGAGGAEGAPMDAGSMLKPALARGGLQLIGATTVEEYRKHLERDAALERRFQPILVAEPSVADTVTILLGLRERYEQHHAVRITEAAAEAAARLSDRYLTDRFLPDKAIDLMDRASARVRLRTEPSSLAEPHRVAVGTDGVATVAATSGTDVTADDVADVVASITGIPVSRLTELDRHRLLHLEDLLAERVVGQRDAIDVVADAVRAGRAGMTHPDRPVGSFLFLGPTGVGKTELATALAGVLYGEQDRLVRLDMTEFGDRHTVSRLVGAPPGYIGHDEAGQLTDAVRRTPYTVVLLDEIEKAHPDVLGILLQVLDAGRLTDARGRTVDFTNTVIIMTSNIGAQALLAATAAGRAVEEVREPLMADVRRHFRPEFLNRIDEIVLFLGLGRVELRAITELLLTETRQRLAARQVGLRLDVAAVDWLAMRGYQPEYGARPLRRTIGRELERHLSRLLLGGELAEGHEVHVSVAAAGDRLELTVVPAQNP
ncbi:ATP-dependent Clp protease ATP-binding subunit [Pseudonocardia spinosispora]|uniref:ATP-dependent Clp protease ATP-binding subunit n=1 Tax=Pseudonocardia spinosispora TaxID=103441 RepID=UPI000422D6AA|nr:ATP-dependent Clp protease ATP-binding subunit [Pseudonocardia spinosispora]